MPNDTSPGIAPFSIGSIFSQDRWFLTPFSPQTWRAAAVMTALAWYTLVVFIILITAISLSVGFIVLWVGIPLLVCSLYLGTWFATPPRTLINAAFDLNIGTPTYKTSEPNTGVHRKMLTVITDPARWRHAAFHLTAFLLTMFGMTLFVSCFGASLAGIASIFYRGAAEISLFRTLLLVLAGIVGLYLSSWMIQALGQALGMLAQSLLGPGESEHLSKRVEDLTESRSGIVAAADDERRRIERDLHDGAQQRLVALSVDLGMSRREAEENPALAIEALERAQGEVQSSLSELRDLVRGVHPQVLNDRGLDAALSAIAARCPIPVNVSVADPDGVAGLPTSISAAAYFVASECLTNIARHSGATSAAVHVETQEERLLVTISDNGVGGAQETEGSGLHGLRRRVEAFDGSWVLSSPSGGGTTVEVSLPCAS